MDEKRLYRPGWPEQSYYYRAIGSGSETPAGVRSDDDNAMNGVAVMYNAAVNNMLTVGGALSYEKEADVSY